MGKCNMALALGLDLKDVEGGSTTSVDAWRWSQEHHRSLPADFGLVCYNCHEFCIVISNIEFHFHPCEWAVLLLGKLRLENQVLFMHQVTGG